MNIKCFASTTDRNPLVPLETLIESKPSTVKRNDGKIDWDESRLDKWSNIKPMDYMFTREKNGYNRLEVKLLWEKLQVPNGRICFPVRFVSAVVSFLPNDWFHATSNTSRPPADITFHNAVITQHLRSLVLQRAAAQVGISLLCTVSISKWGAE